MSYYFENCKITEKKKGDKLLSIKIKPLNGFALREKTTDEEGNVSYNYIDGYTIITAKAIEEKLKVLEVVETKEIEKEEIEE